jgi:hypothetical protein
MMMYAKLYKNMKDIGKLRRQEKEIESLKAALEALRKTAESTEELIKTLVEKN